MGRLYIAEHTCGHPRQIVGKGKPKSDPLAERCEVLLHTRPVCAKRITLSQCTLKISIPVLSAHNERFELLSEPPHFSRVRTKELDEALVSSIEKNGVRGTSICKQWKMLMMRYSQSTTSRSRCIRQPILNECGGCAGASFPQRPQMQHH